MNSCHSENSSIPNASKWQIASLMMRVDFSSSSMHQYTYAVVPGIFHKASKL